ncbi:MAG TPA: class I SAM-dependent methyltransferase, partial [Rectinemataceae bacterium]
ITPSYVEAARETAIASGLDVDFIQEDVRSFVPKGSFDVCINLYTSFGYFNSREEDMEFLAKARRCLAPGGLFVLETLGKELAARDFTQSEEFERSGWMVRTEYKIRGDWEVQTNRWILEKPGQKVDRSFDLRLYSGFEIREAFSKAGFASCRVLGGFDGRPYDEGAESLVVLGRA